MRNRPTSIGSQPSCYDGIYSNIETCDQCTKEQIACMREPTKTLCLADKRDHWLVENITGQRKRKREILNLAPLARSEKQITDY